MTALLFYDDPYQKELETVVTAVGDDWVEFEQTIFYPTGGGQPGDSGILKTESAELKIIEARKGDHPGSVRHILDSADHGLQEGASVKMILDWDRRFKHMRTHTSLHLLCSLVPKGVTGGAISADKGRLDFDLGEHSVDKEDLTEKMNQLIQAAHPVTTEWITDEELDQNPDLVRTMSVQPPRGVGKVRMVRTGDIDFQPCGGTHVANTSEIGKVNVTSIKNKGKRNRRITIVLED